MRAFVEPKLSVIYLNANDIIVTSDSGCGGGVAPEELPEQDLG